VEKVTKEKAVDENYGNKPGVSQVSGWEFNKDSGILFIFCSFIIIIFL
jgi:hypothetical protein